MEKSLKKKFGKDLTIVSGGCKSGADKYAKKLIQLSPEHINSHESMIRFYLAKKDYQESKKWIDKWKTDHPLLRFKDTVIWDDYLLQLEIENLE